MMIEKSFIIDNEIRRVETRNKPMFYSKKLQDYYKEELKCTEEFGSLVRQKVSNSNLES